MLKLDKLFWNIYCILVGGEFNAIIIWFPIVGGGISEPSGFQWVLKNLHFNTISELIINRL